MVPLMFRAVYFLIILLIRLASCSADSKSSSKSHYQILDVARDSTTKQIKKAYRQLALELHPDKVRTSFRFASLSLETAKIMFLEVQTAYAVLSVADKRLQYDLLLSGVDYEPYVEVESDNRYMTSDRIFEMYINTPMYRMVFSASYPQDPIPTLHVNLKVTLSDTLVGLQNRKQTFHRKEVCEACKGTGSKNAEVITCLFCKGVGLASHLFDHVGGRFQQLSRTVCAMCAGRGFQPKEKCDVCAGKGMRIGETYFTISLAAGFRNGFNAVIRNAGHMNRDSKVGDVHTTVKLDLPSNWQILESADQDILMYTMHMKLSDILVGFFKQLFSPSGESIDVDWPAIPIPIPIPVRKASSSADMNNINTDTKSVDDHDNDVDVVDVSKLIGGIYIDKHGFGMLHQQTGTRGILRIRIQCDFSEMDAIGNFNLLQQYGIVQSMQNNATNYDFDNVHDMLESVARRRREQAEQHLLLQHLISVQTAGIEDPSLARLMNMYSATLMTEGDFVSEEQDNEVESNDDEGISLDDFDFQMGGTDIQFDS